MRNHLKRMTGQYRAPSLLPFSASTRFGSRPLDFVLARTGASARRSTRFIVYPAIGRRLEIGAEAGRPGCRIMRHHLASSCDLRIKGLIMSGLNLHAKQFILGPLLIRTSGNTESSGQFEVSNRPQRLHRRLLQPVPGFRVEALKRYSPA